MTAASTAEAIAEPGEFPDVELLLCDVLAAVEVDGVPLGPAVVDTETPDPMPEHFIRVSEQAGRGGVDTNGITMTTSAVVEVYGPRRRVARAMAQQVTNLLLALDRGGSHRGVLVDAVFNAAADAPDIDRDEDDRRRTSTWTFEWRRHRGPTVYLI